MRPQHAEPLAFAGRHADGIAGGAVGVAVLGRAQGDADAGESGKKVTIVDVRQALAGRAAGVQFRQALLNVAAVRFDMQGDHRFNRGAALGVRAAPVSQVVGQWPFFVADPGLERSDKLRLVDDPDLQCDQPKQEVAVGVDSHEVAPGNGARPAWPCARLPAQPGRSVSCIIACSNGQFMLVPSCLQTDSNNNRMGLYDTWHLSTACDQFLGVNEVVCPRVSL